jgi:two-component system, NtrC family, sensor histidine kinase PilS
LNVPERGLTGYVYAFADLTEIRRLEREVRMHDRLAAIGRMAGGIAHEVRNPLTSIAGSVQVLASISELNADQQALVDIVLRESDRLNAIITDFLLYARDKTYKMAVIDLVPLLAEVLAAEERTNNPQRVEMVRQVESASAWTLADPERLKQVFAILCDHALRSMPQGGRLEVSLGSAQDGWRIRFADTSQGLTPLQVEKVFEPFQSQLEGGTGLGLAIVYQTLQAHDARISVHSSPGAGIEFSLELKRAEPPARLQPASLPAASTIAHSSPTPSAAFAAGVLETPSRVKHG